MTAAEIEALGGYYGATPRPDDFESFWQARMAEADAVPLHYTVTQAQEVPSWDSCEFLDLWFTGMEGARLYAKFLRPRRGEPMPLVLQFHGYPGASRSFAEQASFAGMGMALIAMDCPGQAGYSEDVGGFLGTTVSGHIIAGLDGPPERMYYVRLHQNIRILCRLVRELDGIDTSRVFVNGGSQGGGLGLACAALNPELIDRAAILYPFLSDFKLVWDLGADEIAYEGLRYYARWFDADEHQQDRWFRQLGYIDSKNFAPMIRCPVLFGTGLDDVICPPQTQCAVYNNLHCAKKRYLFPGLNFGEMLPGDVGLLVHGGVFQPPLVNEPQQPGGEALAKVVHQAFQTAFFQCRTFDQFRITEYFGCSAVCDQLSIGKYQCSWCIFQHQMHIVCDHHDCHTTFIEFTQKLHDLCIMFKILPGSRLIQNDQFRILHQYTCNRHTFLLSKTQS